MPKIRIIFVVTFVVTFAIVTIASTAVPQRPNDCGVSKGHSWFIVRGQGFSRGDFPWIVALMYTETQPPSFFCGGTLISSTFVISAAHCIHQKNSFEALQAEKILVIFGAHDLREPFEPERISLVPKKITLHEDWNPHVSEYDADISVLEFAKGKIVFNAESLYVHPICIWDPVTDPLEKQGIVTGWGKSEDPSKFHENEPKLIKVSIQTNEECFLAAKQLIDLSSFRTFCAGAQNGSGVCLGDSGGGLFIKVDDVYYLKGIVSSSLVKVDGCDVSRNAVYTNVLKFKGWIEKKTHVTVAPRAVKKVFCTFELQTPRFGNSDHNTCVVNQAIESEEFVLETELEITAKGVSFESQAPAKIMFLPKFVGEKLPNLEEFYLYNSDLAKIRDFYFKDMKKVRFMMLSGNKIVNIEPGAFNDLVKVEELFLSYNQIKTLDERLFLTTLNLKVIQLNNNEIKFLSPTMFYHLIYGDKIEKINLEGNVCIDKSYLPYSFNYLESDLKSTCSRRLK